MAPRILVGMLLVLWTAASAGPGEASESGALVRVEYADPEKFTDVGYPYAGSRETRAAYLEPLAKHITQHAARLIDKGQTLTVSITDVDVAGGFEPLRRGLGGIRVVRTVTPPRIQLRFRLTGPEGVVLNAGDRVLRDISLLVVPTLYPNDPLRYEKVLIDDWLERELRRPAG